jgi:hypothetical protein
MQKWEYHVLTMGGIMRESKNEELEAELNALGQEGWEAVAMKPHEGSNKVTVLLKRPAAGSAPKRDKGWAGW